MNRSRQIYMRRAPKAIAKTVQVKPFALTVLCGVAALFSLLLRGLL